MSGRSKQELFDRIAASVIAGMNDLMGMGEVLNILDELEACGLSQQESNMVNQLKGLFKRLILEESPNPQKDWESINELIKILCDSSTETSVVTASEVEKSEQSPVSFQEDAVASGRQEGEIREKTSVEKESAPQVVESEPVEKVQLVTIPVEDPELFKDFLDESREHLSSIELNIISLEEDPENKEVINAIFRPFHSIKGVAGFLNLKDIHELSHEVENLLDGARAGNFAVTPAIIDIVLQAVDILKEQLSYLEGGLAKGEIVTHGDARVARFINYVRNFDPTRANPPISIPKLGEVLAERGIVEEKKIDEVVQEAVQEGKRIGEKLIEKGLAAPKDVALALREQKNLKESVASIRVDTHKLDNLVDMIGELVIAQSMVLQNPEVQKIKEQKFQKDIVQLRRITGELQRISTSLRMVPIKATFQKMIRLVRDLSRKSGKEVVLQMAGEETEIDRNMVDQIYEPLVHMIRNAIDHGIEHPDERVKLGKPPHGTIFLSAEQKGGNIVIDIKDDGKGLDVEKIRKRAIERGLIQPDDKLEESAIFDLIFHPGFSTKDEVTDVSGRGVGMDVVKRTVEELRGKIDIKSKRGEGTLFELKLPLTMAIIDGMVIKVGSERYVVPTISLRESLRPSQQDYRTVQGRGEMINVRGKLMPLVRLHEVFSLEPTHYNPWEALLLVVSEDGRDYCLLADEILGRQEVVIKSLGTALKHVVGISGGAILGDGRVALIIDVKGIITAFERGMK